jgi:hypothetical protein
MYLAAPNMIFGEGPVPALNYLTDNLYPERLNKASEFIHLHPEYRVIMYIGLEHA